MSPSLLPLRELAVLAMDSLDEFIWIGGAKRGRNDGTMDLCGPVESVSLVMILVG